MAPSDIEVNLQFCFNCCKLESWNCGPDRNTDPDLLFGKPEGKSVKPSVVLGLWFV